MADWLVLLGGSVGLAGLALIGGLTTQRQARQPDTAQVERIIALADHQHRTRVLAFPYENFGD